VSADSWRSLNDRISRLSSRSLKTSVCLYMTADELHVAKLLAIKRPIAIGSKWPRAARHTASKSTSAIGKRMRRQPTHTCLSAMILHFPKLDSRVVLQTTHN
jgi:hypothetical protein